MSLSPHFQPIEVTTSEQLQIDASGAVRSSRFDDIYFYPGHGKQETEHVFIKGNALPERWQQLKSSSSPNLNFVITELGFGTGLNFLVTAEHWLNTFTDSGKELGETPTLYYYSTEKYPLTPAAIKKVYSHSNFELALTSELIQRYPDPISSDYCLSFIKDNCRIILILLFGDSEDSLERLEHPAGIDSTHFSVDAWYLDGFAPAKNASMWSEAITRSMANVSNKNRQTSFATFSVARSVRDHLQGAGFTLEKKPGFGTKRDMLTGVFSPKEQTVHKGLSRYNHRACFNRYHVHNTTPNQVQTGDKQTSNEVAIIGAGIAGCCTAFHLANAGYRVTVFDRHEAPCRAASGNRRAVLFARTARQRSALSDLHEACFHYAYNFYRQLGDEIAAGLTGMIKLDEQLPESLRSNPELTSRVDLSRDSASDFAGVELKKGGILYPDSGYLEPAKLATLLLEHQNIDFVGAVDIESIEMSHVEQQPTWTIGYTRLQKAHIHQSKYVVICAGNSSNDLAFVSHLPIKAIRGQTTELDSTTDSENLRKVICDKGYITPAADKKHECGASYTLHNHTADLSPVDQENNIQQVNESFANIKLTANQGLTGRVGYRATTPDYIPIAGPLTDTEIFNNQYKALRSNAKQTPEQAALLIPNLFVNTGYGSHGFTLAPLISYQLAAQIAGIPLPIGDKLRTALSPNRFLLRALIKNK